MKVFNSETLLTSKFAGTGTLPLPPLQVLSPATPNMGTGTVGGNTNSGVK